MREKWSKLTVWQIIKKIILSAITKINMCLSRMEVSLSNEPKIKNNQTILNKKDSETSSEASHKWWNYLIKCSDHKIFSPPSQEATETCAKIQETYRSIIERYGISFEQFFAGSIKGDDAAALYDLVLKNKPNVVYHVGTFVGYSAMIMAHALHSNGRGILIAVDPEIPHRSLTNPVNVAREAANKLGLNKYVRFVRGWHACALGDEYSEIFKRSINTVGIEVISKLDQLVDLAFIDADHSTSATIVDFMILKDSISLGGVVVFHDVFSWPTVAQAIAIILDDTHFYLRGTRAYFALDTKSGPDGLAALKKIANITQPLCKVQVVSEKDGLPLGGAQVLIPSIDFVHNTSPNDGTVYIFHELIPEMRIIVKHEHYFSYNKPIGVDTRGDYTEGTIRLRKKTSK